MEHQCRCRSTASLRGLAATAVVVAVTAGCGDVRVVYAEFSCGHEVPPAVVVEFVGAGGDPVAVDATGALRDGSFVEQMVPSQRRFTKAGGNFALAGGRGREGVYDIRVETSSGEVISWSRVKVEADRCGPLTVVLQARLNL